MHLEHAPARTQGLALDLASAPLTGPPGVCVYVCVCVCVCVWCARWCSCVRIDRCVNACWCACMRALVFVYAHWWVCECVLVCVCARRCMWRSRAAPQPYHTSAMMHCGTPAGRSSAVPLQRPKHLYGWTSCGRGHYLLTWYAHNLLVQTQCLMTAGRQYSTHAHIHTSTHTSGFLHEYTHTHT